MPRTSRNRNRRRSLTTWISILILLALLVVWWGILTIFFDLLFDDFLWRLTHPFDSGWNKGPWGFLFIYLLLSLPVLKLHKGVDRWLDQKRRAGY